MSGAGAPHEQPPGGGAPPDGTIDGRTYMAVGAQLMQAAQRLAGDEAAQPALAPAAGAIAPPGATPPALSDDEYESGGDRDGAGDLPMSEAPSPTSSTTSTRSARAAFFPLGLLVTHGCLQAYCQH